MRNAKCGIRNNSRGKVRLLRLAVLFFLLTLVLLRTGGQAELIDRVIACVNNDVITLSELNQAVAFNSAVGAVSSGNLEAETLEGLINRRLLVQEAYRLKSVEVTEQEINFEIEKLKKRLGSDKAFDVFLERVDMTESDLSRLLGERLFVERFFEKKIGLFIRVSREEAEDYFIRHSDRFPGKRFQDVQRVIATGLQEQKLEQHMGQYLAEIRNKADIRIER
jgi:peptidyl-prolyl cis-trans isomerase SurA